MKFRMRCFERLAVFVWLVAAIAGGGMVTALTAAPAAAQSVVGTVVVQGNQRVDADTIRAYARIRPGERVDAGRIDEAYKALIGTGLFEDVRLNMVGNRLVISVVENPVINRVIFEGNKKVKDETLLGEVQSKARGPLQRPVVQSDVQRVIEVYRRSGRYDVRVEPKIIERSNNRVDLVFEINEGDRTGVKRIVFVGNRAFSDYRLREVLTTGQTNLFSFFSNKDVYDPDRINADQELLRRFYLKNGYADFRIVAATVELDRSSGGGGLFSTGGAGFVITFTLDEGEQYKFGEIDVLSNLRNVDPAVLRSKIRGSRGSIYNAEQVEKSLEEITIELARLGYAFAQVKPRGDRDFSTRTINITYVIEEGPRVYVERISIRGNSRTRDWVIRREFDIYEGDPYNRVLIDRAERRLKNLGFFKTVKITNEPGSAPDRVVVLVDLEEQLTGEFSVAGGYSTMDGFIAEVSVGEKNFLGRGQYVRVAATLGQRTRGIEFSFTEPYFMDYRIAAGFDLFMKQQLQSAYASYDIRTVGGTLRGGFQLNEELSFGLRYSAYQRELSIPDRYNNCTAYPYTSDPTYTANPAGTNCVTDGESSLAIKQAMGRTTTSLLGYTLAYNALDSVRDPTQGFYTALNQDFAGAGGDVRYIRTSGEGRFYYPLYGDFVFMAKAQGGNIMAWGGDQLRMLDHFFLGPTLVRGFQPAGIGPRDLTPGSPTQDALGGTMYWGTTAEIQFPLFFLPKDLGIKAAVFADAGSLWDYRGPSVFPGLVAAAPGAPYVCPNGTTVNPGDTATICVVDSSAIRSSAGLSIIWASPFGPMRFDFGFPITKEPYDRTQVFRFGGGGRF
jgi:outer membrane protein insertion porin family